MDHLYLKKFAIYNLKFSVSDFVQISFSIFYYLNSLSFSLLDS